MLATIGHWYRSLKTRFFDPLPEGVKNAVKLGLVFLAWMLKGNEGLSVLPLAVGLYFFYRLAEKTSTWMVLVGIGLLIGFYNSTGFGFRSFDHMALNSVIFFTPAVIFLKRLIGGIRRRRPGP